jgi:repressor LexA
MLEGRFGGIELDHPVRFAAFKNYSNLRHQVPFSRRAHAGSPAGRERHQGLLQRVKRDRQDIRQLKCVKHPHRFRGGHAILRQIDQVSAACEFARFSPSSFSANGGRLMATLTKRQKQMVDYLEHYIEEHGYAPTLAEVGEFFGLSSLATVHKHLRNLEHKGFIKRLHNHSRALEIAKMDSRGARAIALLGQVAAGVPIEAVEGRDAISVPEEFVRRDNTFCLLVKGESMVDEGIRDGDYIIVEGRDAANPGETVVALIGEEATVKKYFPERNGQVRLQPANPSMDPIFVREDDLRIRGVVVGLMRHYR